MHPYLKCITTFTSKSVLFLILFLNLISVSSFTYCATSFRNGLESLKHNNNVSNLVYQIFVINALYFLQYYTCYLLEKNVTTVIKNIFCKLTDKILNYDMEFFKTFNSNNVNELFGYLDAIENMIVKCFVELPKYLIFIIYYWYLIARISLGLTFLITLISIILIVILDKKQKEKLQCLELKYRYNTQTIGNFVDAVNNIETVKLNTMETYESTMINNDYMWFFTYMIHNRFTGFLIDIINECFSYTVPLLIAYYSYITGYSQLMVVALLYKNFNNSINNIKDVYYSINKNYSKLCAIMSIYNYSLVNEYTLASKSTIDNEYTIANKSTENNDDKPYITFKNVSFSYNPSESPVLNKFNLTINKCDKLILTGENGKGKSTLVKLLLGLYQPQQGEITVKCDNIRKMITYISQEPLIFNKTVDYNVKYGTDCNISKLLENCDILGIRDWYEKNIDKEVGYQGKNCSGGEKKKMQLQMNNPFGQRQPEQYTTTGKSKNTFTTLHSGKNIQSPQADPKYSGEFE